MKDEQIENMQALENTINDFFGFGDSVSLASSRPSEANTENSSNAMAYGAIATSISAAAIIAYLY